MVKRLRIASREKIGENEQLTITWLWEIGVTAVEVYIFPTTTEASYQIIDNKLLQPLFKLTKEEFERKQAKIVISVSLRQTFSVLVVEWMDEVASQFSKENIIENIPGKKTVVKYQTIETRTIGQRLKRVKDVSCVIQSSEKVGTNTFELVIGEVVESLPELSPLEVLTTSIYRDLPENQTVFLRFKDESIIHEYMLIRSGEND